MGATLKDLSKKRKPEYSKDEEVESFLVKMNKTLGQEEKALYKESTIKYPFIFVFGLPRSGTTLMSQFLAAHLDVGYINNLMARFWLAPVYGIKLSKAIFGSSKASDFRSDYARTSNILDIHEFGYFWRYWLKKDSLSDITQVAEREKNIDWNGLKKVLANIQKEFDRPLLFKNVFGSYHTQKMFNTLGKVLYVYIKRDLLDTAVSILQARKKYYSDLNTWWSYAPVEYNKIKDLDYWKQIAGQIYYLKRYYQKQIDEAIRPFIIEVDYQELCYNPLKVLENIKSRCLDLYKLKINIMATPPEQFVYRTHTDSDYEKEKFRKYIHEFESQNN
jgi:LPS sulfotransferase NodH